MIALDANVLLRLLLKDDADQLARATELLRSRQVVPGERPQFYVPPLVICEIVWVLESVYRQSKGELLIVIDGLLASRNLEVGDRDAVHAATARFREGKGEFSDYYILESALVAGCEVVATFDGDLLKEDGFLAP